MKHVLFLLLSATLCAIPGSQSDARRKTDISSGVQAILAIASLIKRQQDIADAPQVGGNLVFYDWQGGCLALSHAIEQIAVAKLAFDHRLPRVRMTIPQMGRIYSLSVRYEVNASKLRAMQNRYCGSVA